MRGSWARLEITHTSYGLQYNQFSLYCRAVFLAYFDVLCMFYYERVAYKREVNRVLKHVGKFSTGFLRPKKVD